MPNWVLNYLDVEGSVVDVMAFMEKASKPYVSRNFDNTADEWKSEEVSPIFSFWNFVKPENEDLYFGASDYKPEGYEQMSEAERYEQSIKFQSDGWYDWNIRNWGTKWDACDPMLNETAEIADGGMTARYQYETAWSIPEPVMRLMVEQHPTLRFDFDCEEEQGWGAKYHGEDGVLKLVEEWDIPNSHADYVARGNEESCACGWSEDTDDFYDDCPSKTRTFSVVVQKTYVITAPTEEKAWEIAQDESALSEQQSVTDSLSVIVVNAEGQKIFPKL